MRAVSRLQLNATSLSRPIVTAAQAQEGVRKGAALETGIGNGIPGEDNKPSVR